MCEKPINILPLRNMLEKLCLSTACSGNCEKAKCLIGFWFNLITLPEEELAEALKASQNLHILESGRDCIYNKELLLKCQTVILLECAHCREEQNEKCLLHFLRTAFHYLITQKWEQDTYRYRSIALYLRHLMRQNYQDGRAVLSYCRQLRNHPVQNSFLSV